MLPTEKKSCGLLIASIFFLIVWVGFGANAGQAANIEFGEARMIIEFNSTDQDVGIQVFLDAESWKTVHIVAPNGSRIFEVQGRGNVRKLGLTELFFESEEPSLEDLPLDEFLALFPEGEYQFFGTTVEGDQLVGTATFTHNIPDGPVIVSPEKKAVLDPKKAMIRWESVTSPPGIVIAGYQVIVEGGKPPRTFSIDLPATATSVKVPSNFLEAGKKYKVEVLSKEIGGNQTISERSFKTQ